VDHRAPASQRIQKLRCRPSRPAVRSGEVDIGRGERGNADEIDALARRAKAQHDAAMAVGRLLQRALKRPVHGQAVMLAEREILDLQQAAVGMEHIRIPTRTAGHIQRAGAGGEIVPASRRGHGFTPEPPVTLSAPGRMNFMLWVPEPSCRVSDEMPRNESVSTPQATDWVTVPLPTAVLEEPEDRSGTLAEIPL
jgi:hypothetical protein